MRTYAFLIVALIAAGCEDDSSPTNPTGRALSFFVTSATSVTGNLGGLAGADATCQRLATAAGHGGTWRAYLSVERDPANGNQPTHARDRIGNGPWYNANEPAHREQRRGASRPHWRCRTVRQRTWSPDQRSVDGLSHSERARHPHRVDSRWKGRTRPDLRGLDIGFCERDRAGWTFRRNGSRIRIRPPRCRRGTRRTRTRTARTRRLAVARVASTVSPASSRLSTSRAALFDRPASPSGTRSKCVAC